MYDWQSLVLILSSVIITFLMLLLVYLILKIRKKESILKSLKNNLSNIIAIISTLLVFFTLIEMQVERTQAYKPFLVLESGTGGCSFELNEGKFETDQFALFTFSHDDASLNGDVKIPIKNIGVGVANKLEMEFSIDFSANTNRFFKFEDIYTTHNLDRYRDNNSITVTPGYMKFNAILTDEIDEKIYYQSYVLPNSQETIYVKLPIDYIYAVQQYLAYSHENDVPPLILTFRYEDVQGVKYTQSYYLKLSSFKFNLKTDNGKYKMYYTFAPQEYIPFSYGGDVKNGDLQQFDYSKYSK